MADHDSDSSDLTSLPSISDSSLSSLSSNTTSSLSSLSSDNSSLSSLSSVTSSLSSLSDSSDLRALSLRPSPSPSMLTRSQKNRASSSLPSRESATNHVQERGPPPGAAAPPKPPQSTVAIQEPDSILAADEPPEQPQVSVTLGLLTPYPSTADIPKKIVSTSSGNVRNDNPPKKALHKTTPTASQADVLDKTKLPTFCCESCSQGKIRRNTPSMVKFKSWIPAVISLMILYSILRVQISSVFNGFPPVNSKTCEPQNMILKHAETEQLTYLYIMHTIYHCFKMRGCELLDKILSHSLGFVGTSTQCMRFSFLGFVLDILLLFVIRLLSF